MSGRAATSRHHAAALAAVCALAGAVLAGRAADPPPKTSSVENLKKKDADRPLVADNPFRRTTLAEFAIPNADRRTFTEIKDFEPGVGSEVTNPTEYELWCEVVLHARRFAAADLAASAARDVSVVELHMPIRSLLRTELLRFDGQLVCARRLKAPRYFDDNPDLGVKELYEARVVPAAESPLTPVSVVFTELPAGLAAVRDKPPGEWLLFDARDGTSAGPKVYATAAGYFFKTLCMPGEQGNAVVRVPVLIGKGVSLLAGPPVAPGPDPTAIDPLPKLLALVRDEAEMVPNVPSEDEQPEQAAYRRVLLHAHRFTAEQLEGHARTDVTFADLFEPSRKALRGKLVKFEGRLISLRKSGTTPELKAAGVEQVYEGWLVPRDEPRGNPVVVEFTEPLPGITPDEKVSKWVSFAGYSFKKLKYKSQEPDPGNPGKYLYKYAPMMVGRRPIERPDPNGPDPVTSSAFVLWSIVGGALLIVSGGVLTWYFRGGDRRAKAAVDAVRGRNPFDAAAAPAAADAGGPADPNPPPVRPSSEW